MRKFEISFVQITNFPVWQTGTVVCQNLSLQSLKYKIHLFCRRNFYEKRMAQEVNAECLGDEWKVVRLKDY